MSARLNPRLQRLPSYVPGKSADEVQRSLGLGHVVKLASNESPFGPSPSVREAIAAAALEPSRYGDDRATRLRHRLAREHGVPESEVVVTNGSGEAIGLLCQAVADQDAEAAIPERSFMAYAIAARSAGLDVVTTRLEGWTVDVDALVEAVGPSVRIVFLANPGNPTGTFLDRAALTSLLRRLPPDVVVVVDEAYHEYAVGEGCPDALSLRDEHPNLVVLRTFSKAHGLAALRIGYVVAPEPIARALDKLRIPFNTNAIGQHAALTALDDAPALVRAVAHNTRARAALAAGLSALELEVVDSATNFLLVHLPGPAASLSAALLRRGVIVRTLEPYGLPCAIRVTVGLDEENALLLDALGDLVHTPHALSS